MAQILVVDDDPHIREMVRVIMQREGYAVAEAADGVEALERMEASAADLVILDVMMPRMDGWALCKELQRLYEVPLLMLTAKGETVDKVRGFELGTDDYLVKPFDPPELVVRIKALLKRYRINSSQQVSAAGLTLDRLANQAQLNGEELSLPPKEFDLLFMLLSQQGRTLTRDQLIESIWGYDFDGNERTLDVHINRLRERLAQREVPLAIRTVRGLGYRMENAT